MKNECEAHGENVHSINAITFSTLVPVVAVLGLTVGGIVGVTVGSTVGFTIGVTVGVIVGITVRVIWWKKRSGEKGEILRCLTCL